MKIKFLLLFLINFTFTGCESGHSSDKAFGLPVMGFPQFIQKDVNGKIVIDTIEHTTTDFALLNQDSVLITQKEIEGKIFLADVFFTHCPTICPKVKKQMKRIYEVYKDKSDFAMLSYSIDSKRDTVGRLAWFAERMRINDSKKWHLLTGEHEEMLRICQSYLLAAGKDENSPGGFDHSGYIMLMDRKRRIRGAYNGTEPASVDKLIKDIQLLFDTE